jgi:hypothetical protein
MAPPNIFAPKPYLGNNEMATSLQSNAYSTMKSQLEVPQQPIIEVSENSDSLSMPASNQDSLQPLDQAKAPKPMSKSSATNQPSSLRQGSSDRPVQNSKESPYHP